VTDPDRPSKQRRRPLQFSLRSLFGLMLAVALVFGMLRWLEVPAAASGVVLVILIVALLGAVALLAAIAGSDGED
jgi:hypothetical protein